MLSQHPQILIQYEDDTNLETVVNEISTIIQFFCVMIGNITGIDDIYLFMVTRKSLIKSILIKIFLTTPRIVHQHISTQQHLKMFQKA